MVKQYFARARRFFSHLNLPRHCIFCSASSADDICAGCAAELPLIETSCQHCGLPMSHDGLCGDCLIAPPAFARCLAPLRYEPPISHLVGAFKYQGDFNAGRVLSQLLIARLRQENALTVDALIPVPLHWRRRWQRGFNQSEIIADEVSRALDIPIHSNGLRKTRHSSAQQNLDAQARQKNLRDAFSCTRDVSGMHVAVIDDVVTTGATANAIAQLLRQCGAASVQIWALTRTP